MEFPSDVKESSPRRTMIYGPVTTPTLNHNKDPFFLLGVVFKPYAIKELFCLDTHELTNQRIQLNDFFGTSLTEMVAEQKTLSDKCNVLTSQISRHLTTIKYTDDLIKHFILYIKKYNGMLTVKDLLIKFGVSERQLERRFKDVTGLTPRHFLNITKFKIAVDIMSKKPETTLTEIAFELNYFDQPHFIKQAKQLSGLCPKELKKMLPIPVANLII